MDIFKILVDVGGRKLEMSVKAGVQATAETGLYNNGVETPQDRLSVIVGEGKQGVAAWVQVGRYNDNREIVVSHEGWVKEGEGLISALNGGLEAPAILSRIDNPESEITSCQENADVGILACCTAYGSGCYVRCCNSCCSDPSRCPGASCCG